MTTPTTAEPATAPIDGRPDFLVRLGVLLPCTFDDVEAAYRDKVKLAHPDKGGSVEAFVKLQADRDAALEFAKFHSSRRGWLAASIERYAEQETIVAEIRRRGGTVEMQSTDWMAREIGPDFAQVLDRVVGIQLRGPRVSTKDIQYLVSQQHILSTLRQIDLSGARIGNAAAELLSTFPNLHDVRLNGTSVSDTAVRALASMDRLQHVELAHTFVSWLGRFRLRRSHPDLEVVAQSDMDTSVIARRGMYRWIVRMLLLYLCSVFILTHLPPTMIPRSPVRSSLPIPIDKIAHFCIYFGLAFLLACVLALRDPERQLYRTGLSVRSYMFIWLLLAGYGMLDESTQPITGRTFDWDDWLADLFGVTSGLLAFAAVQLVRRRRPDENADSLDVLAAA